MAQAVCPTCSRKVAGGITRCPDCGTKLAGWKPAPAEAERTQEPEPARAPGPLPRPKKRKKKKAEKPGLTEKQKIGLFVGGGLLASFLLIGGVVLFVLRRGEPVDAGPQMRGGYVVVDSLPSPPPEPAEEAAPPLDAEAKAAWAVKPDPPPADEKPPADVLGAVSAEPNLVLASQGGPYAVGVTATDARPTRPGKAVKVGPPAPVLDIRTGKPAGQFPGAVAIGQSSRLSPDGRYLSSWDFQGEMGERWRVTRNDLLVWQRDSDKPACRWPMPSPVVWADFIAPDRLALVQGDPSPRFVILDVAKGAEVVAAPLPGEEFPTIENKRRTFYRAHAAAGAVSPGRHFVALGGKNSVFLVATSDGRVAGTLPVGPVRWPQNYLGLSFNQEGTQLRALAEEGNAMMLRVWSLAEGQPLHKKPYPPFARDAGELSLPVLDGPEANSLIVGQQVFDLTSGQVVAQLPYQPQRWLDPKRLLALGAAEQAVNAKELGDAAGGAARGKAVIVAALDREALVAKLAKSQPAAGANTAGGKEGRPAPAPVDRSKVTAARLKPPAQWAVKPGAEVARPKGPLPSWPHAFAATEGAVVSERLSWTRYDLNTGEAIGEPIALWPGPAPTSRPGERAAPPTAALTRDGKRLALVDPADRARVDVWDTTGKRLIGLRPYQADPILWLGWSAGGQLLTATRERLSGWDVGTGQAAFEVDGSFDRITASPGAEWLLVTTAARHLFFVEASTGRCLGHIPASPTYLEHALSPDGKTLLRLGRHGRLQVWDLQAGKRKDDREYPLVPLTLAIPDFVQPGVRPQAVAKDAPLIEPYLGVYWIRTQWVLSHTKSGGEQHPRYYLYDLGVHTHTYKYAPAQVGFRTDSLGRTWMSLGSQESWKAPDVPGAEAFQQTLAFGPGSTIRVEIDVGGRQYSQKVAEKAATELHGRGFKIGKDGWVLRADHTTGTASTDLRDLAGNRGISVATLDINWRLLDSEGKEVWQGKTGGRFDPFNSKYVIVGSRKTDMNPGGLGGGSSQVRLDYQGKDAKTAQLEEILERTLFSGYAVPGSMPACLVKKEGGYTAMPLEASLDGKKKP